MSAGKRRHSVCVECFRKRRGKFYTGHQIPDPKLRVWEVCCFCLNKHKSGIHIRRSPAIRQLRIQSSPLSLRRECVSLKFIGPYKKTTEENHG
jgi:hypothetical protein